MVVTGFNLSDRGSGGAVEHVVITLLDRMQPGMENRVVGTMATFYGQVAKARARRTLEGLPESGFLLGRESVWERPHRKGGVVLCSIDR